MDDPTRATLPQVAERGGRIEHAKIAATAEGDIRRHMIADGEDPDAPTPPYEPLPDIRAIRERLHMSQEMFAATIGIPVATLRNWEQHRTAMAPAARTLLKVLERESEAVLRALAG